MTTTGPPVPPGLCQSTPQPHATAPRADSPSSPRWVGLDVHKRELTACAIDAQGRVLFTRRLPLSRGMLVAFAQTTLRPGDRVALEATTNCWAVADLLRPLVAEVTVSNPLATKAIASAKIKTDKVDAQVLAQLLRCGYLPAVWPPDAATHQLRQLTGRRAGLVRQRTALQNRVHSVLAMRLIPAAERLFAPAGLKWLKALLESADLDEEGKLLIDSDLALWESLQQQLDRLDQVLAARGWSDARIKLLMTLPGVDVATAEALLAALGEIARFRTPEKAAAYVGLVPSTRQSAQKCYHGPITKRGNNQARWMLIQAAQSVGRQPGPLGHFFRRLKHKKNHNVAVVAVARKLVTIAWHMLTHNEPYRYALPRSTQTKLARLRVKATGAARRTGPAKGAKCVARLPGGSRTIKSLDQVYASEGLPARRALSGGEQRAVLCSGTQPYVQGLDQEHVVPRRSGSRRAAAESLPAVERAGP